VYRDAQTWHESFGSSASKRKRISAERKERTPQTRSHTYNTTSSPIITTNRKSEASSSGCGIPEEKKACSACKRQRPRSCFSKRQWDDEEVLVVPRRVFSSQERRSNQDVRKLALQQEQHRKLWSMPDVSQMERCCSGCGKCEGGEGEVAATAVTFIACPFCTQAKYPSQRTPTMCLSERRRLL